MLAGDEKLGAKASAQLQISNVIKCFIDNISISRRSPAWLAGVVKLAGLLSGPQRVFMAKQAAVSLACLSLMGSQGKGGGWGWGGFTAVGV